MKGTNILLIFGNFAQQTKQVIHQIDDVGIESVMSESLYNLGSTD